MSRGWAGLAGRIGPVKASGSLGRLGRLQRSRTGSADARKGPIGLMGAWAAGGPGWQAGCMGSRMGPADAREWASGSVGCWWAGLSAGAWGGARIGPVKAAGLGRGRKMPGHATAWVGAGLGVVHNALLSKARAGAASRTWGVYGPRGWACTAWEAVELTLEDRLHLPVRGPRPYRFGSDNRGCSRTNAWRFSTCPRRRLPAFLVKLVPCTCWCVFRQRATKRSQRQALIARGVVLIARCERQY